MLPKRIFKNMKPWRSITNKRRFLMIFYIIVTICMVGILWNYASDHDQKAQLLRMEQLIRSEDNNLECKQPVLPVDSPEMMKFVKNASKITCSDKDWVTCHKSHCEIKNSVRYALGDVRCRFTDIIRVDDYIVKDSPVSIEADNKYGFEKSDVVKIDCKAKQNSWSSVKPGIRLDKIVWDRSGWQHVPEQSLKLNILIFGLDSLSRNTFRRKLPKSYDYLVKELKADVLQGYNIVGDGTPQALTPLLTGFTELELPDVRKRYLKTEYVDVYPFLWKDFQKNGYVTAFLEDLPNQGIYTYRLNGFSASPTDHYMRTYYIASQRYLTKWQRLCDGEVPRHKVMLNYIKDFYSVYETKPKFLFGFHGELSHDDYNLVGAADDDITEFLTDLNASNALNNTLLIIMADHGHRFAAIRNTLQGKLEERLPFFSFRFPPWFKMKHKDIYANFVSNLNTLTTPFDVHSTLSDVLNRTSPNIGDLKHRSISLFSKVPHGRSCANAYIEPHWCACLSWELVTKADPVINSLVNTFTDAINNYTRSHREMCSKISVADVYWTTRLKPNQQLLKFKKSGDTDGFVADLSGSTVVNRILYQIKVRTTPGDGIFESSVTYFMNEETFDLRISDVSRINMYGRQARCVDEKFPHLRKFCYCTTD